MKRHMSKLRTGISGTLVLVSCVFVSGCVGSALNVTPNTVDTSSPSTPGALAGVAAGQTGEGATDEPVVTASGLNLAEETALMEEAVEQTGMPVPITRPRLASSEDMQLAALENTPNAIVELEDGTAVPIIELSEHGEPDLPEPPPIANDAPELATTAADEAVNQRIADAQNAPEASGEAVAKAATPDLVPIEQPNAKKRSGFLSALFNQQPKKAPPKVAPQTTQTRRVNVESANGSLPGVDRDRALGVSGGGTAITSAPIQVASAAGLARLTPNGLHLQRDSVDVKCLKPALVRMIKTVERHYGKPAIITSGFRSENYNQKIRGAKNSLHIYCAAADFQIEGVSKWDLASYLRSIPGRGGVGTYCYTDSVHLDIGPTRDWNWRCRTKKKKKK